MNAEWFGYAGAALLTSMSLPQIARIMRDRSAAGVSLLTWCIFAASGSGWLAYGLIQQASAIIIVNITFVTTTVPVVMLLLRRQREWRAPAAVGVPLVVTVGAIAAMAQLPAWVPSSVGVTCGILTTVPQLIESISLRRAGLVSEVSLATLGLLLAGQALWLSYGLARPDVPVILTNAIAASVTIGLIVVEGTRRGEHVTQ